MSYAFPTGAGNPRYSGGGPLLDGCRWLVKARNGNSIRWARIVMMDHLGRDLLTSEHVHHINGDSLDDRLENLAVVDIREHGAYHGREAWKERKARWPHRWSEHHVSCIDCGTTERKHQGKGLCSRCWSRAAQRRRRAKAAA